MQNEIPKKPRSLTSTLVKSAAAIAVSVLALWWAFQGVDLGYVFSNLSRTSASTIFAYVLILTLIHVVRVVRYWLLVAPLGNVTPRAVFAGTSVGIPAAVFLPLRLGEFVRPIMMSRAGVPLAGAFASVVVERVVDGLSNVGLFFALLSFLPASASVPSELKTVALLPLAGFGGLLVFLVIAYVARARALGLLERVLSRVSAPLAKRVAGLIATFLDGLVALGTPQRLLSFLALTGFYWGINGYATYLLAESYGLSVPPIAGPFAMTCVVFAVTVPAGPAFAGTLEAGYRMGMGPFGVSASDSALVALVAHAIQLAMLALFGFIGLQAAESSQRIEKTAGAGSVAP